MMVSWWRKGGPMIRPFGGLVRYSRLARAGLSGLALCLLIPSAQGSTQDPPSKGILHLVVIKIEMRGYRTVAAGTAFFISPEGAALTNSHVVEPVRRDPAEYR